MNRNCSTFFRVAAVVLVSSIALSNASVAQVPAHATPVLGSMKKFYDHINENRGSNPKSLELFDGMSRQITDGTSNTKSYIEQEMVKLGKGKLSTQEIDKLIVARATKAGAPADVIAAVNAAGGPSRVFSQVDKYSNDFLREAKAQMLQPRASLSVEDIVAALLMVSPAEAKMGAVRSWACSVFVYTISFGYASDSNYAMCMN